MYRHTEGNPLFVTEVVRELVQSGELTQARMRGGSTWSVRIPEGVREVIGRRLDRLSERTNETLTVATVIGRQFSLGALRAMTGVIGRYFAPSPRRGREPDPYSIRGSG